MPRDLDDGGHLRATGATAGGLGHLALLHTSTYHPVPIQRVGDPQRDGPLGIPKGNRLFALGSAPQRGF